jgi:hypothetical protein
MKLHEKFHIVYNSESEIDFYYKVVIFGVPYYIVFAILYEPKLYGDNEYSFKLLSPVLIYNLYSFNFYPICLKIKNIHNAKVLIKENFKNNWIDEYVIQL